MAPDTFSELILRPAQHIDAGTRAAHYRSAERGELHRLVPGRYVTTDDWTRLDADARHRLLVHAAVERLPEGDVVSHWSAAALWGLPVIGRWPDRVHVSTAPDGRRASTTALVRHQRELVQPRSFIDGIAITSLAETVIDVARIADFAPAVAMADAALWRQLHPKDAGGRAGVTRPMLDTVVLESRERRGLARARRVVDFSSGKANRPGESLSRVTMAALGVPAPTLQHIIPLDDGRWFELDFYWPEFDVGADFDGRMKYLDPKYRGGRTADQVVYDEKIREDEIRSRIRGYGRFDWSVAGSMRELGALLKRIGLQW